MCKDQPCFSSQGNSLSAQPKLGSMGQGHSLSPFPPRPFASSSFTLFTFPCPFLIRFICFLFLFIPSVSTRIVPLRFQARGRRKRPNLGLVFMAALCTRTGHYIFALWFLSSIYLSIYLSIFFFSLPNLSGRRLDVYHTLTHGVALVRIWNAGLKGAARSSLQMQDPKKSPKIAIWTPSHNFVGLCFRN